MRCAAVGVAMFGAVVLVGDAQSPGVTGRVVADSTGDPVANARVTLTTTAATATLGTPVVLTDATGRFAIAAPAGGQRVVASKSGYARGEPIPATAGQPIEIRLRRGATISGRVVDRFGDPVAAARVAAQAPSATRENSPPVAVAESDDRGEYRLAGLPAGHFIVVLNTMSMMTTPEIIGNRQVLISRPEVQRTYYPGAATPAEAQAFDLQFGDEQSDIDFVVSTNSPMGNPFGAMMLTPSPLQPPATAGVRTTGVIRGHVMSTDGRGLSHAQVRLMQATFGVRATTSTDEDGRFEFTNLPSGKYGVIASKMGYSPVGQDDSPFALLLNSGPTFDLAEDETREKADVKLRRWGTLEGRVFDELGDPIQGAAVQLLHIRYENGRRRLVPAGGAAHASDDLGRYRIYALPPGRYVVSATVSDAADLPGYARSYFPGTPNAGQAQFVSVAVSQDVVGIDFSMSRTGTARISGRMIDAAGQPTTGGTVQLLPSARSASATSVPTGARILPDGQFEFANVPPGQYVIQTYRGRQHGSIEGEFSSMPVTVNGTDIKNLMLQASAGSSIKGRITFNTFNDSRTPARSSIELSPIPTDFDLSPQNNLAAAEIHDDWSFDIKGVNGPRRLQLTRVPKGWTLEAILVHRLDATDRPLPFGRPDQSLTDVEVVLTDRMTELSGTIADDRATPAAGASLIVFPTNRDRWYSASRFLRTTTAGSDGAFVLSGLPMGTYYAAAVAQLPQEGLDAWQDPEFLESLIRRASTVTLSDAQKASLNLRLATR
jgi:carboxypeptidase family protein